MAEIINLRQARKAKTRTAKQAEATQNRVTFGRTKAEKQATKTETARHNHKLDGAKTE